jgi:hypothetical protein
METFLSSKLDEIPVITISAFAHSTYPCVGFHSLVGADTGSLEGFGAQLFILVGYHVNA